MLKDENNQRTQKNKNTIIDTQNEKDVPIQYNIDYGLK